MQRAFSKNNFMYEETKKKIRETQSTWLVTGVAGFIGANLLEALLNLNQKVVGVDNFFNGLMRNLEAVRLSVGEEKWGNFRFVEGDIADLDICHKVCSEVDYVLHQAAIGSVPRSFKDPLLSHRSNDLGFINMLVAARDAKVKRFVFATSSSTYGDHPASPKVEDRIGKLLSPYAATKYVGELYADVFARCYGIEYVGLRYFNVFGKFQRPDSEYSAVIPKWIANMISGEPVIINGDGETSRDFCFVENNIQANLLAAMTENREAVNNIYNIAVGESTTLNELSKILQGELSAVSGKQQTIEPVYQDFRKGDVQHSLADISKAHRLLGYKPEYTAHQGLRLAISWYLDNLKSSKK